MTTPPQRDMRELDLGELRAVAAGHAYPLAFATVSGAHLYGFPSRDSDVDLRGAHVLPLAEIVGLRHGPDTVERSWTQDGADIDLVTHDVAKFLRLLLKPNGYVLEQLLSPIVIVGGATHDELVALAPAFLTTRHAYHYHGFARSQQALHERTGELKPLLYTLRVLLTGIHLMRTGETLAHVPTLAAAVPEAPSYLGDLVAAKAQAEHGAFAPAAFGLSPERIAADVAALHGHLDDAAAASDLPDASSAEPALDDLLVRVRLGTR